MKYYPVSLNISGKSCIIVGGGEVAERKARRLLESGADVTVVSEKLTPALEQLRDDSRIRHVCAAYTAPCLEGAFLVFGTTDDEGVNSRIFRNARERGILVNIADDPLKCDFILPSLFEQGDLQIAVSTGGKSPALARQVRTEVEAMYGAEYAVYLMILGELRKRVIAGGRPSMENKQLFEAVVNSDILDMIRRGDRRSAEQLIFNITGVDMDLERLMPMKEVFFFNAALIAYFAATIGYMTSLLIKRVSAAGISVWILLTAFVMHGLSFAFRSIGMDMNPVVNLPEALSFLAWVVTGSYLVIQWKVKAKVLGIFITPILLLLMIGASSGYGEPVGHLALLQNVKGGLVTTHVILSLTAEALFAVAGCAGLGYLIQSDFLKHRKVTPFSRMLPSLGDLDRINHVCLLLGFPLLTLGIIAGSLWARVVWGSHWNWDPKQVWTLVIWIVYAVLLHQRLAIGWTGRKVAICSIAATVLLFFTLIGVNAFHTTTHRFV